MKCNGSLEQQVAEARPGRAGSSAVKRWRAIKSWEELTSDAVALALFYISMRPVKYEMKRGRERRVICIRSITRDDGSASSVGAKCHLLLFFHIDGPSHMMMASLFLSTSFQIESWIQTKSAESVALYYSKYRHGDNKLDFLFLFPIQFFSRLSSKSPSIIDS